MTYVPGNAFESRFLFHQELDLTGVVHVRHVYRPVRVGDENGDVLELFLPAVVLLVEAEILHEINGGPAVDEDAVLDALDVILESVVEIFLTIIAL